MSTPKQATKVSNAGIRAGRKRMFKALRRYDAGLSRRLRAAAVGARLDVMALRDLPRAERNKRIAALTRERVASVMRAERVHIDALTVESALAGVGAGNVSSAAAASIGVGETTAEFANAASFARSLRAPRLASTLRRNAAESSKLMARQLQRSFQQGEGIRAAADRLLAAEDTIVHLPRYLTDLEGAIRRGVPGEVRRATRQAISSARNLGLRIPDQAGTLRNSAFDLVAAAERGGVRDIDRQVRYFIQEKARYQARRIARTEASRAFGEAYQASTAGSPNISGMRWMLSASHPAQDVCFPGDTMIATPNGSVRIADVSVGDIVISAAGVPRAVVAVSSSEHSGNMVNVCWDGGEVTATENHPIATDSGWTQAGDLQKGQIGYRRSLQGLETQSQRLDGMGDKASPCFLGCETRVGTPTVEPGSHDAHIASPVSRTARKLGLLLCTYVMRLLGQVLASLSATRLLSLLSSLGCQCRSFACCTRPLFRWSDDTGLGASCMAVSSTLILPAEGNTRRHTQGKFGGHGFASVSQTSLSTRTISSMSPSHREQASRTQSTDGAAAASSLPSLRMSLNRTFCSALGFYFRSLFLTRTAGSSLGTAGMKGRASTCCQCERIQESSTVFRYVEGSRISGKPVELWCSLDSHHNVTVFNLQVDVDNTYYANGLAVHNCDIYASADANGMGPGVYPQSGLQQQPAHPHCLCYYVAVMRTAEEIASGQDAPRGEPQSYDDWILAQPIGRQAAVVGQGRARELRSGSRILDRSGELRPLYRIQGRPPHEVRRGRAVDTRSAIGDLLPGREP